MFIVINKKADQSCIELTRKFKGRYKGNIGIKAESLLSWESAENLASSL